MKQNIFYELIICLLIWGLLGSSPAFALQNSGGLNKEYLSPRINLSKKSLKKVIRIISRMQVEDTLQSTVANIHEIGRKHFNRELSPKNLLVALSMIYGSSSLRDIDNNFRSSKNLKQTIMEIFSVGIGWSSSLFCWKEKRLDFKNQFIGADPVATLSEKQKKRFRKDVKKMMRYIIKEKLGQEKEYLYNYPHEVEPIENLTITIDQVIVDDVELIVLEFNSPSLLLSSI